MTFPCSGPARWLVFLSEDLTVPPFPGQQCLSSSQFLLLIPIHLPLTASSSSQPGSCGTPGYCNILLKVPWGMCSLLQAAQLDLFVLCTQVFWSWWGGLTELAWTGSHGAGGPQCQCRGPWRMSKSCNYLQGSSSMRHGTLRVIRGRHRDTQGFRVWLAAGT